MMWGGEGMAVEWGQIMVEEFGLGYVRVLGRRQHEFSVACELISQLGCPIVLDRSLVSGQGLSRCQYQVYILHSDCPFTVFRVPTHTIICTCFFPIHEAGNGFWHKFLKVYFQRCGSISINDSLTPYLPPSLLHILASEGCPSRQNFKMMAVGNASPCYLGLLFFFKNRRGRRR